VTLRIPCYGLRAATMPPAHNPKLQVDPSL
jgi:hypothetical protein